MPAYVLDKRAASHFRVKCGRSDRDIERGMADMGAHSRPYPHIHINFSTVS
jgi:hypothetical protein